jgi:hypothetical protein
MPLAACGTPDKGAMWPGGGMAMDLAAAVGFDFLFSVRRIVKKNPG